MHEANLLKDIPNQEIIKVIFDYCPIHLMLKIAKNSKALQRHLSVSKLTYSLYSAIKSKKVIKYNSKDAKPPIKELMLSSLTLTDSEFLYQKKERKDKFIAHTESIYSIILLSNNAIATGSKDKKIKIWSIKQLKCLKTLTGHTGGVLALIKLINQDLLSASFNSEIIIWDKNDDDYRLKQTINLNNKSGLIHIIQLKNSLIAMSHWDMSLELFDINENKTIIEIKPHTQPIIKLHQLTNGDLVTVSRDQTVKLWQIPLSLSSSSESLECTLTMPMKSSDDVHKYVTCFMECEKCSRMAFGYRNGSIIITNSSLTKSFGCVKYHNNAITSIIKLANSNNCACIGYNENILLIIDMINTNTRVILNTKECFDYMLIQLNDNRLLAGIRNGYLTFIGINSEEYDMKLSKGDIVFKRLKASH